MCARKLHKKEDEGIFFIKYLFSLNNLQHIINKFFEASNYVGILFLSYKNSSKKVQIKIRHCINKPSYKEFSQYCTPYNNLLLKHIICYVHVFYASLTFFLEGVQLDPLMQNIGQSESISDKKCCKYYVLNFFFDRL